MQRTVDIKITQQNPTLVTKFEIKAKHRKIRSDQNVQNVVH